MNSEQITYHVEFFFKGKWHPGHFVDTLELARDKRAAEIAYFDKVRIIKETRTVTLEEID